jgi:hypothetical protein
VDISEESMPGTAKALGLKILPASS